ncbi:MAG: ATP-grasp domain-containing protein [Chloroflexota bacterium]
MRAPDSDFGYNQPMPSILLTSPRTTPDATRMAAAATRAGQPAQQLTSFRPPDTLNGQQIAIYGESLFAIIVSTKLDHALLEPTPDWLAGLPQNARRRDVFNTSFAEARQLTSPHFIKGAQAIKGFDARVYPSGADLPADHYPDDYPVIVSEVVSWAVEYRFFVLDRKIATGSVYFRDGALAQNPDGSWIDNTGERETAKTYLTQVLAKDYMPLPAACVVDVGYIYKRGWAIVEANPAYGAGLYDCSADAALDVINRATVPRDQLTDADRPWVTDYEVED